MSENNFTDVFNDPNLPVDYASQHIDDIEPEEPREEEVYEPDQDTPPLPTTHEEVIKNLSKHPEAISQHFVEAEAIKHGIDFDHINGKDDEFSPRDKN